MCGRYTLTVDKSTIEKSFGAKFYIATASYDWEPTYNAAPSQLLPIIRSPDRIEPATWGFVPEGWKNARIRPQNNARLETADTKPMFRESFSGRHCLVLADSFYEWQTLPNGKKQPYRIMLKSGEPFAMAGIYARSGVHAFAEGDTAPITFAVLTTTANEIMQPIHERMPVIMTAAHAKSWLHSGGTTIFQPFPSELMTSYPVTPKMSKASFNVPEAIQPFIPTLQLQAL